MQLIQATPFETATLYCVQVHHAPSQLWRPDAVYDVSVRLIRIFALRSDCYSALSLCTSPAKDGVATIVLRLPALKLVGALPRVLAMGALWPDWTLRVGTLESDIRWSDPIDHHLLGVTRSSNTTNCFLQ